MRQGVHPLVHLLRAVKLAWPGDVVEEMSAEGEPKSNGAASSSVYVIKGHVRRIKVAVALASAVDALVIC